MKTTKRIILSVTAILFFILTSLMLYICCVKHGAIPVYEGNMVLEGLDEEVRIYFDERGMPHIYAGTEKDLYYATGWVMARERLWQIDLIRRATRGRLSELFGSDYVNTDISLRSLSMTEKSKIVLENAEPEILQAVQYYCDGVNKYIADARRTLPPEFHILRYRPEAWTPEDVANIIGYMGWDLASGTLSEDLFNYRLLNRLGEEVATQIIPDWKEINSYVYPDFNLDDQHYEALFSYIKASEKPAGLGISLFSGSNNWAVSGDRSATGMPVLSNDMHLGLGSPGIWIQIHQVVPGKLNVTGVAVPGQPFVVAGHNEHIAWGLTNLMVDDIDLFVEKTDSTMQGMYYFNGEWREMEKREEVIKIKGGGEIRENIFFTHRGPIISGMRNIRDAVVSMRWSGYDTSDELYTIYKLNRASSWDEFRDALSHFRSISQNFAYADVYGNIGMNAGGGIPLRKGHGTMIRDGATDEYDWTGYVPFDRLPSVFNPENGFVSSANNKTVSDDYPYYISTSFSMPYRIDRIRKMLSAGEKHDIADMKRMITDQTSEYASLLVPLILNSIEGIPLSGSEEKAAALLRDWDMVMSADKEAPSVFEFFRPAFAKEVLGKKLGNLYKEVPGVYRDYYIYRLLLKVGDKSCPATVTEDEYIDISEKITSAFRTAVSKLEDHCISIGMSDWKWGDIHKLVLEHPIGSVRIIDRIFVLNSPAYRTGGSNHTVCPYSYGSGFSVNHGASQRHIYNTADWDDSWSIIPTGNSGIPGSPYYLSQTAKYVEGGFYRDYFSEEAVRKNSISTLILKP